MEKKRFKDRPYNTFSIFTATTMGLDVKCPYCNGLGVVKMEDSYFSFQCSICGKRKLKDKIEYRCQISEMCNSCQRHFRVDITDKNQANFKVLKVCCPYCRNIQNGQVQKIRKNFCSYSDIQNGIEPFFNYQLFYQTTFDGKLIWAINREHLMYLINYIGASIREKGNYEYRGATQSYRIPKFIKLARNREPIVKLLKRLLEDK